MPSVEGRFQVDVQFQDWTAQAGVKSLKTVSMQESTEYPDGKVALATGTVGTGTVTLTIATLGYRDSLGGTVAFSSFSRVGFVANGTTRVILADQDGTRIGVSRGGAVAMSLSPSDGFNAVQVYHLAADTANVATFTVLLYGS